MIAQMNGGIRLTRMTHKAYAKAGASTDSVSSGQDSFHADMSPPENKYGTCSSLLRAFRAALCRGRRMDEVTSPASPQH